MTLEEDIVDWVNDEKRPLWQKAVFARLCANETITEEDISAIADSLLDSTALQEPEPLRVDDIPGSTQSGGETVQLTELKDVKAVNALIEDQRLTFPSDGLTIIYGDNGSGKSGYARLIRKAVTAKAPLDEVLPNVFVETSTEQSATYVYSHGGREQEWQLGAERSRHLSSVRFFDEECGDSYITRASVVNYRPSALSLFDRLGEVCIKVQDELTECATKLEGERSQLPRLPEKTESYEFLRNLKAETTDNQLDTASKLTEEDRRSLAKKLGEHARLKASDPAKERVRLRQVRAHWKTVKDELDAYAALVTQQALDGLDASSKDAQGKRQAAILASDQSFKDEPLPHVGSDAWRALWEAAREFSMTEAYHKHTYPNTTEGARCVLCQQLLDASAAERLQKFEDFVTDKTAQEAAKAERLLASKRMSLESRRTLSAEATKAIIELEASEEPVTAAKTWLDNATSVAKEILGWLTGEVEAPVDPMQNFDLSSIDLRIEELEAAEVAIDEKSFNLQLVTLQEEIDPLQARQDLGRSKELIKQEIQRLKNLRKIQEVQKEVRTTPITRKRTELSEQYVTGRIQEMFVRECQALELNNVTYAPAKGRKDVALEHQPALDGAVAKAPVHRVLSEGEQTALGLAGFLTEVELDESRSAVVFDDPVSSLDAQRRSRVAKRLVDLAESRQVIVFTHEATFVHMLNKESEHSGITPVHRAIMRLGGQPGKVIDKHPWAVKDVRDRIEQLRSDLKGIQDDSPSLDDEQYTKRTWDWAGGLSQVWERAVITEIAYRIVKGGTAEVQPAQFRILPKITEQDGQDFDAGYTKASLWAKRHDQAPERNSAQPPSISDMQTELERIDNWVRRVKKYKE